MATVFAIVLFASAGGNPTPPNDFQVSQGQLTFDAEGLERPGSVLHSRQLHWPGGQSGVTIGRGYDMKLRTSDEVYRDFMTLEGMKKVDALAYAKGAGKLPQNTDNTIPEDNLAATFVNNNRNKLPELTPLQQKQLFEIVYPKYVAIAKKAFSGFDWAKLDPKIRDVLTDLAYRGDLPIAKRLFKKDVGSLAEFARVMADRSVWRKVPCDRFYRRTRYLREALDPSLGTQPQSPNSGGRKRIIYDDSAPKSKSYRNSTAEKIGRVGSRIAQDAARLPADKRPTPAEFVRQMGKELSGRKIDELDGSPNDQFKMLSTSPFVTRLWVPDRLSDAERGKLKAGRKALDEAKDLAKQAEESRRKKNPKEATKLWAKVVQLRNKARKQFSCLEMALQDAQERADAGEMIVAVWPSGGRVAWIVPSRSSRSALTPSAEWGNLPVPRSASAGGSITGFAPLSTNFGHEALEGLALFALSARPK